MNRGIAKRTIFETAADYRYFISRLAYASRRGEIEVHSFVLMSTHYRLLVRSPTGQLSEAMRRIQNEYVRYFNRTRKRDGSLFRGRFRSIRVDSLRYRVTLVHYIDFNPVKARICTVPWDYAYGSAIRFAPGMIPKWLCPTWIMNDVPSFDERQRSAYGKVWGRRPTIDEYEVIQSRIKGHGRQSEEDDLDFVFNSAPHRVRYWMIRKAKLADGSRPGMPVAAVRAVRNVVAHLASRHRWRYSTKKKQQRNAWPVVETACMRHLCGLTLSETASHLDISPAAVSRRLKLHVELMKDIFYARRVARIAIHCTRTSFGG